MKGTHGHRPKHAGGKKHVASGKHHPNAALAAAAKAKAIAAAKAAALQHVHTVAAGEKHPKPAKWSPTADVACCAFEALAASARLAGHHVDDADILDLYWRLTDDPDAGASLSEAFAAAAEHGLGAARLLDARPARRLGDGVVIGVDLADRHALVVDGHGVWTWGTWRPAGCDLLAAADEAWELTWQS